MSNTHYKYDDLEVVLGISKSTIRRLVDDGKLRAQLDPFCPRFSAGEIEAYLQEISGKTRKLDTLNKVYFKYSEIVEILVLSDSTIRRRIKEKHIPEPDYLSSNNPRFYIDDVKKLLNKSYVADEEI